MVLVDPKHSKYPAPNCLGTNNRRPDLRMVVFQHRLLRVRHRFSDLYTKAVSFTSGFHFLHSTQQRKESKTKVKLNIIVTF